MKEPRFIDLHSHTIYSDSIDDPKTLVRAQKLAGLDIIAKTDHDNFEGYYEAKQEADSLGLILVPGVEFSAGKYHILGLGFDPENDLILKTIEDSKSLQRENSKKRTKILNDYGVPISIEKVEKYNPKARIGKMNILFTILKDPECRDYLYEKHKTTEKEFLRKFYLGSKGIAGTEDGMRDLDKKTIIETIHTAGGIAILAHPSKDVEDIESELQELRNLGLDGLEVQPRFFESSKPYIDYAKKHNLLITYGSDYHGSYMNRSLIGRKFNKLYPELEKILGLTEELQINERREILV